MPDGTFEYLIKEINRKLFLVRVGTAKKKVLQILDDLQENDIPALEKYVNTLICHQKPKKNMQKT